MKFQALQVSLDVIRSLKPCYARIKTRDPDLARQLRKALASVCLNLSEGARRTGKDRMHLWRVAAGSAAEAQTCFHVAEAWGDVSKKDLSKPLELLDRVLAMAWKLTN